MFIIPSILLFIIVSSEHYVDRAWLEDRRQLQPMRVGIRSLGMRLWHWLLLLELLGDEGVLDGDQLLQPSRLPLNLHLLIKKNVWTWNDDPYALITWIGCTTGEVHRLIPQLRRQITRHARFAHLNLFGLSQVVVQGVLILVFLIVALTLA